MRAKFNEEKLDKIIFFSLKVINVVLLEAILTT